MFHLDLSDLAVPACFYMAYKDKVVLASLLKHKREILLLKIFWKPIFEFVDLIGNENNGKNQKYSKTWRWRRQ